jgi:hypothetical protein
VQSAYKLGLGKKAPNQVTRQPQGGPFYAIPNPDQHRLNQKSFLPFALLTHQLPEAAGRATRGKFRKKVIYSHSPLRHRFLLQLPTVGRYTFDKLSLSP